MFIVRAACREGWDLAAAKTWTPPFEQQVDLPRSVDGLPRRLALRFGRVLRYRDDKLADEAHALDAVPAFHVR
jgi:hypothetical protein